MESKILNQKSILGDRVVQVLLFIIFLIVATFVLLWRLDVFVNGDLYDFGLIFSFDWATDYWYFNGLLWGFLGGAAILSVLSIIPQHQYSNKPGKINKILGSFLPILSITYVVVSIWCLTQINVIVHDRLFDFGLSQNFNWAVTYNTFSSASMALLFIILIATLIPAIRTLEIIKIEIETEE